MHDEERDPIERLRAADPAAGVEPRAGFVDEVIASATADVPPARGDGESEPGASEPDATVTDLGTERARRRPRWVSIAAVAASIAVVGLVGYGVGASTGGASTVAGGAAPPISLQGSAGGSTEQAPAVGAADGSAAMKSAVPGADLRYPMGAGRTSFSASGLSSDSGAAAGYAFDARAASDAATIDALAAALGVAGSAQLKDGAWSVGPQDGSAPSLNVSLDGTLGFFFSDPSRNPWNCPDPAQPCQPTGSVPSEQAALDALRSLITASGRDADAYEYATQTWDGAVSRTAQAWLVVDGQRIDQSWSAEIGEQGLFSASGQLAELVGIGDYPVVSAQAAFERLSDPRFGAAMSAMPIAMREPAVMAIEGAVPADAADGAVSSEPTPWVAPTEPPAAPASGSAVAWPVDRVEIVGARLGLASQWQPDGSVLVVPAYEFTAADGSTWSVIAVDDAKLDFASTE